MQRFVHRQNLERYRRLLDRETDPECRAAIERLKAEEEAKDASPPSDDGEVS